MLTSKSNQRRKRYPLFILALSVSASFASFASEPSDTFHKSLLTLDTHIDIPSNYTYNDADPTTDSFMQVDLKKMYDGGLDSGFFIVYVPQGPLTTEGFSHAYSQAKEKITAINRYSSIAPEKIDRVDSASSLIQTNATGKLAIAIGMENAYPLGAELEHLEEFYALGVRYISLTHSGNNHLADSSTPKGNLNSIEASQHQGLSTLGKKAIAEFNRLGIMIDVSHTSKASTLQAIALSQTPVIASHSAIHSIYQHPRNLQDDELKAIAKSNGVVQIVAYDSYLKERPKEKTEQIYKLAKTYHLHTASDWHKASQKTHHDLRANIKALNTQWPSATLDDYIDHIDYAVKLIGIDHVGLASDFGGGGGIVGWENAAESHNVTQALLKRGYSIDEIKKLWGGNLLRVWGDVETFSRQSTTKHLADTQK